MMAEIGSPTEISDPHKFTLRLVFFRYLSSEQRRALLARRLEFLREQRTPLGRITGRRMSGKTGVFCDGLMFGMVTDDMLYLRVDDHNRTAFKEAESFPPLSYEKKGCTIDLSFWRAPERLYDEPDELVTWARVALAAAGG